MNLEEAIETLNEHKHRDFSAWEIKDNGAHLYVWNNRADWFTEFEAIAIAEKYRREPSDVIF